MIKLSRQHNFSILPPTFPAILPPTLPQISPPPFPPAHFPRYDMAPKAFLEKYLVNSPVLQTEQEQLEVQPWALVSEVAIQIHDLV